MKRDSCAREEVAVCEKIIVVAISLMLVWNLNSVKYLSVYKICMIVTLWVCKNTSTFISNIKIERLKNNECLDFNVGLIARILMFRIFFFSSYTLNFRDF